MIYFKVTNRNFYFKYDDETYFFIRAIKPDIIEYCVSTEKKIKKNEFIEEPEEIKLV